MYEFRHDWFSGNIPGFSKHLAHLRDIPCTALEIGSYEGRSAVWLLDNILTNEQSRLTCIDIFEQPLLSKNLKSSSGSHKTQFILGASARILKTLPLRFFDFVYIDGFHGQVEVLEDAVLSFRLAKTGAMICFDDYAWNDPKLNRHGTPKIAIDAFLNIYNKKIDIVDVGYQIWIRKKSE
jgi:predicted O-methyltransferase YrrM